MAIGQHAPIDPMSDLARILAGLNRRVGELERRASQAASSWSTLTLADANWSVIRTPQWRLEGDRVWLRGAVTRISSTFSPGSALCAIGGDGEPPAPALSRAVTGSVQISSVATHMLWVAEPSTDVFRSTTVTVAIPVGDLVFLDGLCWPLA